VTSSWSFNRQLFLKSVCFFCEDVHFFGKIWCTLLLHKFLLAFYEISISPCTCTRALMFLFIIVIISHRVLAIQACSIFMSVGLSTQCWCMLLLYVPNTSHYLHSFFSQTMIILGILWFKLGLLNDWHGKMILQGAIHPK